MVLKRILLWLSRVAIVASLLIPGGVLIGALLRLARGVFLRRTNEDTPAVTKLYLILSVVYLLSPIDLIPDVIPVIGYLDDLVIVLLLVGGIVREWSAREQRTFVSEECCICFEPRVEVKFLPCSHACCCKTCAAKVSRCPLDRSSIERQEPME